MTWFWLLFILVPISASELPFLSKLTGDTAFQFLQAQAVRSKIEKPQVRYDPNKFPIVHTSKGAIRGHVATTPSKNNTGLMFLSVPFAEPPVGELRFRSPVPKFPWSGTLDTLNYAPGCWQYMPTEVYQPSNLAEDCLYLNVHAPADAISGNYYNGQKKSYPVIYYVYGGAWEFGDPKMMSPVALIDNFVSRGIIFVTVAYRLGPFGFWSTGTKEAPGNYILEDMILGLKWVNQEISRFGGDPKRITIQGHSSGAQAVSALSLSPKTDGLFQQATFMSGTILEGTNDDLTHFKNVSNKLGCDNDGQKWENGEFDAITECVRRAPAKNLLAAYLATKTPTTGTSPRVDGPGGVLPETVQKLAIKRKPLKLMLGTTINESPNYLRSAPQPTREQIKTSCDNIAQRSYPKSSKAVASSCLYHYDVVVRNAVKPTFYNQPLKQLENDLTWYTPEYQDAHTMTKVGGTAYLYSFSYIKKGYEEIAPFHAMDLAFVFGFQPLLQLTPLTDGDKKLENLYSGLYANFAIYGNPTPSKPEGNGIFNKLTTPIGFNYYDVNETSVSREFYHFDGVQFWDRIVPYVAKFLPNSDSLDPSTKLIQFNAANPVSSRATNAVTATSVGLILGMCAVLLIGGFVWRRKSNKNRYDRIPVASVADCSNSSYATFEM